MRWLPDQGTSAKDALWVKFAEGKTKRQAEFRTPDGDTLLHLYLDENERVLGVEIFP
jgi:hypothetical protein